MKKIIILLIFFYLLIPYNISLASEDDVQNIIVKQKEVLHTDEFIYKSKNYMDSSFKVLDFSEVFSSIISGELNLKNIFNLLKEKLILEFKNAASVVGTILIIVLIHSIFKIITENLKDNSVSKIAYFAQYVLIIVFTFGIYSDVIEYIKSVIQSYIDYTYLFIPILMTLIASTGNTFTATSIEPIILFSISILGTIISNIIIPMLLVSTTFSIISNVSESVKLDKISKFIKTFSMRLSCVFINCVFRNFINANYNNKK